MHRLPNILTAMRLIVSPIVVLLIFMGAPNSDAFFGMPDLFAWVGLGFFALAGLTDYLDGYLARSRGWISRLGRLMDPIADKVLIISVIAALLAVDRLPGWHFVPALIIIIREICIAGLREFLSTSVGEIPVSFSGKIKTFIQILSLGFLIAASAGDSFFPATIIGLTLLWLAAAITLISAYEYVRGVMPKIDLSEDNDRSAPVYQDEPWKGPR
ncbi:MAG: CDP-diacylglycerol--glycerol-3-phosphate 3-phosphatidyltransferase [Alphaproteobacteria bacterium]|nr:CDP-diacylglycerol--glycerol-3-phosphate 3-phosphatidyltransferase [Alphaproteobacteria bacterium]